jgi:hypothetical protein
MSPEMAKMGFDAIMGISNGWLQGQQIKAQNTINAANTAAANLMRGANNELIASRNSLNRYVQNVNNQRVAESAGAELEAATINYRRARDGQIEDDFESQIAFAEQAGAQAAMGGASGLTGGVVDIVNSTTALRQMRAVQRRLTAVKQVDYDAVQERADNYRSGLEAMDQTGIVDDIDYSIDTFVQQKRAGNFLTDALGGQSAGNLAAVAGQFSFKPKVVETSTFSLSSGSGAPGMKPTGYYGLQLPS